MINKSVSSATAAVAGIEDGASVMIGGFGEVGNPTELVHALIDLGPRNLTVINNNAGNGRVGLAALLENKQVSRIVCSFPRSTDSSVFTALYRANEIELELVPQGTLAERIRAAGAGIGGFYTQTTVATPLADGKEVREFNGKSYVLETPLTADYALVKCEQADSVGNLLYRKTARNFGPIMCTAATTTIVQCRSLVATGSIDPEHVVTPGIFVDRVVEISSPVQESQLIAQGVHYLSADSKGDPA